MTTDQETIKVVNAAYQVLYADTDGMGVVYNGTYFRIFEFGRGAYLTAQGMSYKEIEGRGLSTPVTEAYAHYYLPFKYDDRVVVETGVSQIKRASFRFDYRLSLEGRPEQLYIGGYTVHALVNSEGKIVRLPDWLKEVLR